MYSQWWNKIWDLSEWNEVFGQQRLLTTNGSCEVFRGTWHDPIWEVTRTILFVGWLYCCEIKSDEDRSDGVSDVNTRKRGFHVYNLYDHEIYRILDGGPYFIPLWTVPWNTLLYSCFTQMLPVLLRIKFLLRLLFSMETFLSSPEMRELLFYQIVRSMMTDVNTISLSERNCNVDWN